MCIEKNNQKLFMGLSSKGAGADTLSQGLISSFDNFNMGGGQKKNKNIFNSKFEDSYGNVGKKRDR